MKQPLSTHATVARKQLIVMAVLAVVFVTLLGAYIYVGMRTAKEQAPAVPPTPEVTESDTGSTTPADFLQNLDSDATTPEVQAALLEQLEAEDRAEGVPAAEAGAGDDLLRQLETGIGE